MGAKSKNVFFSITITRRVDAIHHPCSQLESTAQSLSPPSIVLGVVKNASGEICALQNCAESGRCCRFPVLNIVTSSGSPHLHGLGITVVLSKTYPNRPICLTNVHVITHSKIHRIHHTFFFNIHRSSQKPASHAQHSKLRPLPFFSAILCLSRGHIGLLNEDVTSTFLMTDQM